MDDKARRGSLPDGWIVKVSKNFPDRVYYFNIYTGSSTWECPALSPSGCSKNKKLKDLSTMNESASDKQAAVRHEVKSPDLSSKIVEFLSDAKRQSHKRSAENEFPSGPSLHSKLSNPPTAVVTPVVSDKSSANLGKKKKKRSKKRSKTHPPVSLNVEPANTPSETVFKRQDSGDPSKKVSFTVRSQNKMATTKSESALFSKTKSVNAIYKKKQSLLISVPTDKKQNSASVGPGKRSVILDKLKVLPSTSSSDLSAKRKESLDKNAGSCHRLSTSHSRKDKSNVGPSIKVEKSSQNQLNENNKRRYDVLNIKSGEDISTSKSTSVHELENEVSDMDCEMDSDFEDLTITVTSAKVNAGASTTTKNDKDRLDDIEMIDMSSSDMVKIDDIFVNGLQGSLMERYFLVVDTNVFIGDLNYIDDLKDTPVNGCGPPHFVIPWVVFQELDCLKKNGARPKPGLSKDVRERKTHELKKAAGDAINYLNTLLKAKHPRFHFQRPDEAKNCQKDFSRNNDDKLLECCIKLQERLAKEKVILLTNDRNLENKAMVCNIIVHDRNSISKALKPDLLPHEILPQNLPNPTYVPEPFKVLAEHKFLQQNWQADHEKWELEIDAQMTSAKQLLKEVLDPFFEKEMDEAYGDAWHFFPVDRHVVKGILNGIIKYWRSVFALIFSKQDKEKFEFLQQKVNRPEGFLGERQDCFNILQAIEDLFLIFKRKWPKMHVPVLEIHSIKALTTKAFSNLGECEKSLNNIEKAIKEAEMSCCIEVFNHNWTVINHLCGCTLDFCGIPHKLVYDRSAPVPPKSEFIRIIPGLCHSLGELKDVMEKMLHIVKSSSPNGTVFKDLHKILMELVPSLNIQAENLSVTDFTPKLLERFCRLPENRTRVEEGYKQLVEYYENLSRGLQVLLTEMS